MEKKPQPPEYFRTKKWILVISSMFGVWLFYTYCEKAIEILNSKEFLADLGHSEDSEDTTPEFKAIKRWAKISFVLLSGAGIIGQLCGVIGGMRGYPFMVNAHVFVNLAVVLAHLLLFICAFIFSNISIKRTHTFDTMVKIGAISFLAINITVGFLFRKDINLMHYQEKLSRCTCSYIAAAQAQFAAQQAQQQQLHQPGGGNSQGQQQYITGPDGSRYMIARPPPIGGSRPGGGGDGNGNPNENGNGWPVMGPGIVWP